MSTNVQMDIDLYAQRVFDYETTGYKIRERREELKMSSGKLEELSGVSKSNILKAERSEVYLNNEQFQKVCVALDIEPESIIDNEYIFFYLGYGRAIDMLIEKMGHSELLNYLQVQKATLLNWKTGLWIPRFKQRRMIIKKYNELQNN